MFNKTTILASSIFAISMFIACGTKKTAITANIEPKPMEIQIDTILWNEHLHNFKDVPSGPPAVTKFYFINKTKEAVTITKVEAGCSCTASDYTKDPIKVNDTAWITASYKTSNTFGMFKKHLDVGLSNGKNFHLILTGNVDPMMGQH
jgi:hypothetical protein